MAEAFVTRRGPTKSSIKRRRKGKCRTKRGGNTEQRNWKCKFIKGMVCSQKCGFPPFHPPRALEERSDEKKFRNIQPASYSLKFLLCQPNGYYASIWKW